MAELTAPPPHRVLLVEDDCLELRKVLGQLRTLSKLPWATVSVASFPDAWRFLAAERPDLVLIDLDLAQGDPAETVLGLTAELGPVPLLAVSSDDDTRARARCLEAGLDSYHSKGALDPALLASEICSLLPPPVRSRAEHLLHQTRTPAFRRVVETCLAVAPTRARVLLLGETGTGKEVLARAIHGASGREGPFVAVNCAAVSKSLMQAELFGHERGAFTGAVHARAGLFEQADGGTLFLDEIGDMPLSVQAATLRTLEEGTIRPVGSSAERAVDVRVLAATSIQLDSAVLAGRFREDLLYRLDVIRAEVPALRERRADVVPLFRHFCATLAERHGLKCPDLAPNFEQALLDYPWPGNIRQLANLAERLILTPACGPLLHADDLYGALGSAERIPLPTSPPPRDDDTRRLRLPADEVPTRAYRTDNLGLDDEDASLSEIRISRALSEVLDGVERRYLEAALTYNLGHIEDTAATAGLSRRTLLRKLKKHGLQSRDYNPRRRRSSDLRGQGRAEEALAKESAKRLP